MGRTKPLSNNGTPYLKLYSNNHSWEDGWINKDKNVVGTYVHGIMDSAGFREDFLNNLRIKKGLKPKRSKKTRLFRFKEYDRLADYFEIYCDIKKIFHLIGI